MIDQRLLLGILVLFVLQYLIFTNLHNTVVRHVDHFEHRVEDLFNKHIMTSKSETIVTATPTFKKCECPKIVESSANPQTEPLAVDLFRQFVLQLPPPKLVPLQLTDWKKEHYSQMGQDKIVDTILRKKKGGFFIEAGAYDGESLSNTLFFEKSRNWTGLLIEPNPRAYRDLLRKDRNAYLANSCISLDKNMAIVEFLAHGMIGGIANVEKFNNLAQTDEHNPYVYLVNITCFPLDIMLEAIGVNHVDYFSLDVEGREADILQSIPFDKLRIDVFSIENNGEFSRIQSIMRSNGYTQYSSSKGDQDSFWIRK